MRNITRVILLIFAALLLAACSGGGTSSNNAAVVDGTSAANSDGAITSGIGESGQLAGVDVAANKMKAPYDQVYYFDFDKDIISQTDQSSIVIQARYLISHTNARVRLEGYTDERGSREYNVALGWHRAKAVASLLEQDGVSPKQIVTISYGEEKPIVLGHTEAAYSKNRRMNLVYEVK